MSFQEDYEFIRKTMAENGRGMPDVTTLTPRQVAEMTTMITQTAAELRANNAAMIDADGGLAQTAAQMAEVSVRKEPVIGFREEVFQSSLADGKPARATLFFAAQDDGTVDWTFSVMVQEAPQATRISIYRGTIGKDGVSYARMHRDEPLPLPHTCNIYRG